MDTHGPIISILLVDDHQMIREGLKEYLQGDEGIRVVGESKNGKEAFQWLQRHEADVVITDVSMPVMDGIELARVCKQNNAHQKVLVLSTLNDDRTIKRMISTGVNGYILKTCPKDEFISSIKEVYSGKAVYSLGVTNVIMQGLAANAPEQSSKSFEIPLNQLEYKVLRLLCDEKTNKEISSMLSIDLKSVESLKYSLFEKTGNKNVAGLVVFGLEHHLID